MLKEAIRTIPDWPKQGVMFRDITTLLQDPLAYKAACDALYDRYKDWDIDKVIGVESRGFIFGAVLAYRLGVGLVVVRKPGKLPSRKIKEEYSLEYGTDALEMHYDAIESGDKVLVVDDLIATGGTVAAAARLVEKLGGNIVELCFVIGLPDILDKSKIANYPYYTLINFSGE